MEYSIIYSFDVPFDVSVARFKPPRIKKWDCTEGDSEYDYGYLGGRWQRGKHRKYCALLSDEDFQAFIDDQCLSMEDVQTMGSLGAPGFGVSIAPACSFNRDDDGYNCEVREVIANAYVTPCFTEDETKVAGLTSWEDVHEWMLEKWG